MPHPANGPNLIAQPPGYFGACGTAMRVVGRQGEEGSHQPWLAWCIVLGRCMGSCGGENGHLGTLSLDLRGVARAELGRAGIEGGSCKSRMKAPKFEKWLTVQYI